jgi:DNA-binding transcriptional LysR family regulator
VELKQLRSFIAVARALNFSRAARDLHLSQPALSAQIKALEEGLGTMLLKRNRRMVKLTPAGESLLADAAVLLQNVEDARQRALRVASGEAGHLRIAFVASAVPELVPAIALAFRTRYPLVTLELKNMPTVLQVEALEAHALDVGFVRLPLTAAGLAITPLHSEPFALAVSKSHRLARKQHLTVADLAGEPFVTYAQKWAPEFYQTWTGICRRAGFTPVIARRPPKWIPHWRWSLPAWGSPSFPRGWSIVHRRLLRVSPLPRETARSQIGIAVARGVSGPLRENLIALAKRVVKQ